MPRTVGVEEELLLVDPSSGETRAIAAAVLAQAHGRGYDGVEPELKKQQVEIASDKHDSIAALLDDLRERRSEAGQAARDQGVEVVALATAPLRTCPSTTEDDRYQHMADEFGLLAHEQLTCGCHVHVEIASPDEGVAVLDRIRPWLAVLLALSANSPFWQGQDTGFASYRHELWGRWPSAGPTELFHSATRYREVVTALVDTPALMDRKMVYFDARLSDRYPTIEIRVADVCLEVADAAMIAALCRGLVDTAAADARAGVPADPVRIELLRAGIWTAAHTGLQDRLLDPRTQRPVPAAQAVEALVRHVRPALIEAGDDEWVHTRIAEVLASGNGAQRQCDVWSEESDFASVVRAAVAATAGESRADRPGTR